MRGENKAREESKEERTGDKELNRITFRPGESCQFAHFLPRLMWLAGHT